MQPYILYGGTFSRALGPQMVLEEVSEQGAVATW